MDPENGAMKGNKVFKLEHRKDSKYLVIGAIRPDDNDKRKDLFRELWRRMQKLNPDYGIAKATRTTACMQEKKLNEWWGYCGTSVTPSRPRTARKGGGGKGKADGGKPWVG